MWLMLRSVDIWKNSPPPGAHEVDWSLARAATIIIALLLAHSFVDYPLRTNAIMAIFAFSCALLIKPLVAEPVLEPQAVRKASQRRRTREPSPVPVLARRPATKALTAERKDAPARRERWGLDIQWPEEWREPSQSGSTKPET